MLGRDACKTHMDKAKGHILEGGYTLYGRDTSVCDSVLAVDCNVRSAIRPASAGTEESKGTRPVCCSYENAVMRTG